MPLTEDTCHLGEREMCKAGFSVFAASDEASLYAEISLMQLIKVWGVTVVKVCMLRVRMLCRPAMLNTCPIWVEMIGGWCVPVGVGDVLTLLCRMRVGEQQRIRTVSHLLRRRGGLFMVT